MPESLQPGLYVVATPIGNLEDLSPRARRVLSQVDLIAAENTLHTKKILDSADINTPMLSFYQANEGARLAALLERLKLDQSIALVSSAGTPLISDPGYHLIRAIHQAGLQVFAVPGPSALTAALSVAGLPTDRFVFEGFLPAKEKARRDHLLQLAKERRTMVFFEAPHRLSKTLEAINTTLGSQREMSIAREMSKRYEKIYVGRAGELLEKVRQDSNMSRGELVLLVQGDISEQTETNLDEDRLIEILLQEFGPAQAGKVIARLTGRKRSEVYQQLLALKGG